MAKYACIGKSILRVDAREKVTGEAVFAGDIQLAGTLTGKIKSCPYPFARILAINTEKARRLRGVRAVITARDVTQFPYGLVVNDELPLADQYARYAGDGVAAVAAIDEDIAEEALELIEVEYEELTPVLNPAEALKPGAPVVHPERAEAVQNIAHRIEYVRGEGEAAFQKADLIIEDRFFSHTHHQAYLEPQACIAQWNGSGKLSIWGSTQSVFTTQDMLARSLGIPEHRARVVQPYVGGGFGGKKEMRPIFPITALLAKAAGRPVKVTYTREEEFISGRPRLAETIDLKLGFKKDGTMVAKSAVITADAGAYAGCCPHVMAVSTIRPDCLYRLPNIKMLANLVYTNTIPRGGFRGFGNPQMLFAMESLIDMAAEKLGIDPIQIKQKNSSKKGDVTAHGWILKSCGFDETLRLAREKSDWTSRRRKKEPNRGVGVASQVHVSGNRAVAKARGFDGSAALVNIDQWGRAKVISGETDLGQGMTTVFAQIAAEALGMKVEDVEVLPFVDADIAPFCYGTFADRVTVLGGNAVLKAAKDARKQLLRHAALKLGVKSNDLVIKDSKFFTKKAGRELATVKEIAYETVFKKLGGVPITGRAEFTVPDYVVVPDKTGYGNYALSYTFSTAVVEVAVDTETGKVDVLDIWYAVNVGRAINPKSCEGQIEGGVVQGVGFALAENYIWGDGRVLNPNFTDYKIPLSQGIPDVHSYWVEQPNPGSPYGAKGIGEPVLNPIAPAIANAVYNAIGVRIKELPITPEKILKALKETAKES
ncbi:MAG: xanthine dehydrogenase family protein molybdopterin-binding subunit [Chloroflexota bacterium]|nr:xanthine dehydrogenase family protein molybdopterin-binding subunit [Chloroflexota bacterium]